MSKILWGSLGAAAIVGLGLLGASMTIVKDGTVAVQTHFTGKVNPVPFKPGLHFVNPFSSMDVFSARDLKLTFDNVPVPSQDKFKTSVDITLMVRMDPMKAAIQKINGGSQSEAIDKYVTQKFLSTVRESGKSIPRAQDLFESQVQSNMQNHLIRETNEYSQPYGYTVTEVFLQDIVLDQTISDQVRNTKIREEQVNAAQADLDRIEKEAQQDVKRAEAARQSAEQKAIADERTAEANKYAAQKEAEGKLYAAQKEAEANSALQKTITPQLIEWKKLQIEEVKAHRYQGGVPQTVVGANYTGGLLMDIREAK